MKEEIGDKDLPILEHLTEIKKIKEKDSKNYSIVFVFSENDYFKNTELKKKFIFGKEEDMAEQSEGTEIEWVDDSKNVTVKKV